jgi:hypothetical protein
VQDFQELADEAFSDLLRKHGRPTDLKTALRQSVGTPEKSAIGEGVSMSLPSIWEWIGTVLSAWTVPRPPTRIGTSCRPAVATLTGIGAGGGADARAASALCRSQ